MSSEGGMELGSISCEKASNEWFLVGRGTINHLGPGIATRIRDASPMPPQALAHGIELRELEASQTYGICKAIRSLGSLNGESWLSGSFCNFPAEGRKKSKIADGQIHLLP